MSLKLFELIAVQPPTEAKDNEALNAANQEVLRLSQQNADLKQQIETLMKM